MLTSVEVGMLTSVASRLVAILDLALPDFPGFVVPDR